jgi:hemerythrin-like domain-containing protein
MPERSKEEAVDSLEILRQEHRVALRVARAARRDIDEARLRGAPDLAVADKTVEFFRYFTNVCHSPKEEDLLFTAVHRHGLAWEEQPLHDLVGQHQELRITLDSAADWSRLAAAGVPGAPELLLHDLLVFLDLLERHIELEEYALFPLAVQRLHPQDMATLACEFADIACEEQEEGMQSYYAGVARELAGAGA